MDVVKTIDMKWYRKNYLNYLILVCIMIAAGFIAMKNVFYVSTSSALFELLMLLIVFPNKFFFKKELDDEDIVFI